MRNAEICHNRPLARRFYGVAILIAGLISTSCASIGAKKLVSTHTAYNDAVQLTVTREVLANIVRTRYADPMQFLQVSSINAQFSVKTAGSAGVGGIGAAAAGDLGGTVSYGDSPTITYVPQADAAFYKSLYSLFSIAETAAFVLSNRYGRSNPEWQALSIRLSFGAINGAEDFVDGQLRELYNRRVDAFVRLIGLGASLQQVAEWDLDTTPIATEKVTAEDKVAAFKSGLYFVEEDDGENVRLGRYRLVLALALSDPQAPAVIDALVDLGVKPGRARYIVRPPTHAFPGLVDPYAIWVTPRSMRDVLYLAARYVDVPQAHDAIVPQIDPLHSYSALDSSIHIHHSEETPPFPYRVQHRGYWFYVDDTEIESKVVLEAIVAAFTSRVGSKEARDEAPQLVLPLGGG
jgi:hypothetical protein